MYSNIYLDDYTIANVKDQDLIRISGMLQEIRLTFQDEVYLNEMKEIISSSRYPNKFNKFNTVELLNTESCGCEQIRLKDNLSYIAFKYRSDLSNMYVVSQKGTLPQIRNLVRTVVKLWNNDPKSRIMHTSQKNV